ncbi:MAG: hypothetical protein ACRD0K_03610 [Egibacteraceae bacterium]
MFQSLEVDVAALELLPETDPIGLGVVALGCGITRVFNCNRTCGLSCFYTAVRF